MNDALAPTSGALRMGLRGFIGWEREREKINPRRTHRAPTWTNLQWTSGGGSTGRPQQDLLKGLTDNETTALKEPDVVWRTTVASEFLIP
jgi:hypothetical protein